MSDPFCLVLGLLVGLGFHGLRTEKTLHNYIEKREAVCSCEWPSLAHGTKHIHKARERYRCKREVYKEPVMTAAGAMLTPGRCPNLARGLQKSQQPPLHGAQLQATRDNPGMVIMGPRLLRTAQQSDARDIPRHTIFCNGPMHRCPRRPYASEWQKDDLLLPPQSFCGGVVPVNSRGRAGVQRVHINSMKQRLCHQSMQAMEVLRCLPRKSKGNNPPLALSTMSLEQECKTSAYSGLLQATSKPGRFPVMSTVCPTIAP